MRRIQKILLGMFLGGIFLGGVGTGVAVVEYSSLSYGGEQVIGRESMVTENFDYSFDPGKGSIRLTGFWGDVEDTPVTVEEDSTVPEGVIRYKVTYNKRAARPYLSFDENDVEGYRYSGLGEEYEAEDEALEAGEQILEAGEQVLETGEQPMETGGEPGQAVPPSRLQGTLRFWWSSIGSFDIWMENKDRILGELKDGRISSYQVEYIKSVRVLVNPASRKYVYGQLGRY